jgi:CheY-like chemotaxis protein
MNLIRRVTMADKIRLLLACSDPESRKRLTHTLGEEFETISASNVQESSSLLAQHTFSLVFCEDLLPGGGFPRLMNEVKRSGTSTPLVVLSRTGEWEEFLAALRLGAFDMVIPPYERLAIHAVAYNALQESHVSRGNRSVEALPRMAPRSALHAASRSSLAQPYPGSSGPRHGFPNEHRSVPDRSNDNLPAAAENWPRKKSLSTPYCPAGERNRFPAQTNIASEIGG